LHGDSASEEADIATLPEVEQVEVAAKGEKEILAVMCDSFLSNTRS